AASRGSAAAMLQASVMPRLSPQRAPRPRARMAVAAAMADNRRPPRRRSFAMSLFERLKSVAADDWNAYVDHAFVRGLGDGSLPGAAFRNYLVQDYLFLIQFARAHALAAYKSRTLADMRAAREGLAAILDEMGLHLRVCERWGLSA